jgi:hypothetical protein
MRTRSQPFKIGDAVTLNKSVDPNAYDWDGIVVDVIPDRYSPLFRVYWRYPRGKVANYRSPELRRR